MSVYRLVAPPRDDERRDGSGLADVPLALL